MSNDPRTFHIASDRDGFFIEDDYGEDQSPTRRFTGVNTAQRHLNEMVAEYLDNYEPPDPPGFEAGFAENH